MTDVKEWILEWFENNTYKPREELEKNSGENYFEAGLLDSFGFISFISAVEDYFEITFDDSQLQQPDFSTIDGISAIIIEVLEEKGSDR